MASISFLQATPRLPNRGIIRRNGLIIKRASIITSKQDESDGKSVDENMIVLRMRIKKMKVLESGDGEAAAPPSSDWTEWEKKVFSHYHEGVFDTMQMLQTYLMNTRPSVALGMMALFAMALPLSSSVVMMNVLKLAKGLLAGSHVCIDIDF